MMRKPPLWQRAGGLLLLLLLLAAALAACSTSGSVSYGCCCEGGGTVIDAISQEPSSLLPQRSNQPFAHLVQAAIRTPLFATNSQGDIVPALATEVPTTANGGISHDGLTLTIHLRSGTKWSDGQPVTADDVLCTSNLFRDVAYTARDGFQTAASEARCSLHRHGAATLSLPPMPTGRRAS